MSDPKRIHICRSPRLSFPAAVHQIRDQLAALQNAPHEQHAGPLCPICGLTTRLLNVLEEYRDD